MRLCREALNMKLDTSIRNNIKGLIYGQAIGGTDTNGCVAGSMLGVKYGFSSIPESWVDGLGSKEVLEKKYRKLVEVMEESC